jgi:hypothetical protein
MKSSICRRRPTHRDIATRHRSGHEPLFFGGTAQPTFFPSVVQRKCAACEKEDNVQRAADKKEEEKLQRKESGTAGAAPQATAQYIGSINGKGRPMDGGTRSFFEGRMGNSFGQVRIHTDGEAARSASGINARAYTYGNHVVFGEGQYRPESSDGKQLLAHELAHVVQQGGAGPQVQRQVGPAAPVPHFRDCVPSVTGRDDADALLSNALATAQDFVQTYWPMRPNPARYMRQHWPCILGGLSGQVPGQLSGATFNVSC